MAGVVTIEVYGLEAKVFSPFAAKEIIKHTTSFPKWEPTVRCWKVRRSEVATLVKALQQAGYQVRVDGSWVGIDEKPIVTGRVECFEQLFKVVPKPLHKKLYQSLARVLHPDVGGTNELMRSLNMAFDKETGRNY